MEALGASLIGATQEYAGRTDPGNGWMLCDGRALPRTGGTYDALFAILVPPIGTPTVSGATFTLAAHGLLVGDRVIFTTTGVMPTGLSANTAYYVIAVTASTFTVSATQGGAVVTTSSAGTGTLTVYNAPHGVPDATNFNLPDFRGRFSVSPDNMGTAAGSAGRLPSNISALGAFLGEERHVLAGAETGVPSHAHGGSTSGGNTTPVGTSASNAGTGNVVGTHGHNFSGSTNSDNDGHNHGFGYGTIAVATGSNSLSNAISGGGGTYASGDIQQGHTHGGNSSTGNANSAHTHSFGVPALTVPALSVPAPATALSITPVTAAPASAGHNNLHPHLHANRIIRVS